LSPKKNRPVKGGQLLHVGEDLAGITRNRKTAFRRLSEDMSDWIPRASWNSYFRFVFSSLLIHLPFTCRSHCLTCTKIAKVAVRCSVCC